MSFDYLGNYEQPQLILCNPGTLYINDNPTMSCGIVQNATDIEIVYNYSDYCELSFRSYLIESQYSQLSYAQRMDFIDMYNNTKKYKYVFVRDVGFFRIDSSVETTQNGTRYKDVRAVSCDAELQNYLVPYITDGTYPLIGVNQNTGAVGILSQVMSNALNWGVGYVDPSLIDLNRSFSNIDVSKNIYAFMKDELQEAFDCVFLFDILNRKVNVVRKRNIGTQTDIHITQNDLVDVIKISDPSDGPFTAFRVFGDDAMSISAVNPLGGNVVYNFTNYIGWMDDSLRNKVRTWQNLVTSSEQDYYEASVQYFRNISLANNALAEINRLNEQKRIYTICRENIISVQNTAPVVQSNEQLVAVGGEEIALTSDVSQVVDAIDAKVSEIDSLIEDAISEYNSINDEISYYGGIRSSIHDSVDMGTYFTSREMRVLSCYMFEKTYTDNYITLDSSSDVYSQIDNMDLIYHRAKNTLSTISEDTREFTVDTADFLFVEKFLPWAKQIAPACIIHVELSDLNVVELFLSSIAVNYEDRSTRLTFSNKPTSLDRRTLFDNLFEDFVRKSVTNVSHNDTSYDVGQSGKFITTMSGRRLTTSDGKYLTTLSSQGGV